MTDLRILTLDQLKAVPPPPPFGGVDGESSTAERKDWI